MPGKASPDASRLAERTLILASEASRLATQLGGDDELGLNEQTVRLQALTIQAQDLLDQLPDATLASEHRIWSRELESIVASVLMIVSTLPSKAASRSRGTP